MKIGRNDPCPCKSGKKFKKCCLNKSFDEFVGEMRQKIFQREDFQNGDLLIGRPMISTEFQGYKIVAVGNRVFTRLPADITFHDFIIIFLKDILTPEWCLQESEKHADEQHLIIQWIKEMGELFRDPNVRVEDSGRDIKSVEPSGNVQSLRALAYDIYCIYHTSELPPELIERLKIPDQFQGAKFEISVAGIIARAGFHISWIPHSTQSHAEFIATHRDTGEKITVEAKSRHRGGVLKRPGIRQELKVMRAKVTQLFNKAIKKPDEGNPLIIFIDVNLPLTDGDNILSKEWVVDIKKMLDQYPKGTKENPDAFTALFVTNFSWHYHEKDTNIKRGETLTIVPFYPKRKVQNQETIGLLHRACEQYGVVPPFFPD